MKAGELLNQTLTFHSKADWPSGFLPESNSFGFGKKEHELMEFVVYPID